MNINDTRRINVRMLVASLDGGQRAFADKMEMDAAQVSQLIGKNPTRNIGGNIARRIEVKYDLDPDILDKPFNVQQVTPEEVEMLVLYRRLSTAYREKVREMGELYLDKIRNEVGQELKQLTILSTAKPSDELALRNTEVGVTLKAAMRDATSPQPEAKGDANGLTSKVRNKHHRKNQSAQPEGRGKKTVKAKNKAPGKTSNRGPARPNTILDR